MDVDLTNLRRARLIKTCLLPIAILPMGLNSGLRGPTLLDFTELLQCSVAALSSALMFYPIGIIVGSISGGVLADKLKHLADLLLAVNCCVMAVCFAAMPWCPSLWTLRAANLVSGFGQGNFNVACNSLLMRVWGEKAAAPIHALHAIHSVGLFLAAPLAGPFLSTNTTNHTLNNSSLDGSLWNHNGTNTMIEIPYGVVGCVTLIAASNFAIFHCVGWTFSRLEPLGQGLKHKDDSATCQPSDQEEPSTKVTPIGQENKTLKAVFLISLLIIYVGIMYRDFVNHIFLFAIGHTSHLHMSKQLATVMMTTFFGCHALGRLASIVFARYVKIHFILFAEVLACVLFSALMAVIGLNSVLNLWLLSCLLAFFSAPTYPTVMAWSNHYLVSSGVVLAVIDVGIGVGAFSGTWIGGLLYDNYGATAIFYLSLSFALLVLLVIVCLQICAYLCVKARDRRNATDHNDAPQSVEPDEGSRLIN